MNVPERVAESAVEDSQVQQIVNYVKENKMISALVLLILWQTGTLLQVYTEAGGALCG